MLEAEGMLPVALPFLPSIDPDVGSDCKAMMHQPDAGHALPKMPCTLQRSSVYAPVKLIWRTISSDVCCFQYFHKLRDDKLAPAHNGCNTDFKA